MSMSIQPLVATARGFASVAGQGLALEDVSWVADPNSFQVNYTDLTSIGGGSHGAVSSKAILNSGSGQRGGFKLKLMQLTSYDCLGLFDAASGTGINRYLPFFGYNTALDKFTIWEKDKAVTGSFTFQQGDELEGQLYDDGMSYLLKGVEIYRGTQVPAAAKLTLGADIYYANVTLRDAKISAATFTSY